MGEGSFDSREDALWLPMTGVLPYPLIPSVTQPLLALSCFYILAIVLSPRQLTRGCSCPAGGGGPEGCFFTFASFLLPGCLHSPCPIPLATLILGSLLPTSSLLFYFLA